jgi:hypothetical protein
MGEVFRARDTRLNRKVAIKLSPKAFAADAERLRRPDHAAVVVARFAVALWITGDCLGCASGGANLHAPVH